jgi:hypothetical protein
MLFAACGVTLALLSIGCKKNRPPTAPQVSGPTLGKPGASLTYSFSSTDPENQEIAYKAAWGDTSTVDWSSTYASGQQVTRTHAYPDSGVYRVKVKAKDTQEAESEWSDSIVVSIGFRPPNQPGKPAGPVSCSTSIAYTFTVKTTHPRGDSVWFQFDWGGVVGNWGGPAASDSQFQVQHTFDSAGTFGVMVRAKDVRDGMSPWSEPLNVSVVQSPGGPPLNLLLSAHTDSTIALYWTAPTQGTPSGYNVYFKDVAAVTFALVGTISSTTTTHDPHGATGLYTVSAVFGTTEHSCADTLSTVPVHTVGTTVSELNSTGNAGYGWDRTAGTGATYTMELSSSALYVDFYITDWATGFAGPIYQICSPDEGPNDPGGVVPPGSWRVNGFTNALANENDPLPTHSGVTYFNWTDLTTDPILIGCYTNGDGYYALVRISNINLGTGTVQAETWFQKVAGLRLIKH